MPITATPATVPNLSPGQLAFKLPSGELFIIEIMRLDVPIPATQLEQYHHWRVRMWQVNADGTQFIDPHTNKPVIGPTTTENIHLAALADGRLTVAGEQSRALADAWHRFAQFLAGHSANKSIPLAS